MFKKTGFGNSIQIQPGIGSSKIPAPAMCRSDYAAVRSIACFSDNGAGSRDMDHAILTDFLTTKLLPHHPGPKSTTDRLTPPVSPFAHNVDDIPVAQLSA